MKETEQGELIICSSQGDEIARHRLSDGYNQRIIEPAHYKGISSVTPRPTRAAARQVEAAVPPALPAPVPDNGQVSGSRPGWAPAQVDAPQVEIHSLSICQALAEDERP